MPELSLVATPAAQEANNRRRQMLRTAFGPTIAAALADPTVLEVMVMGGAFRRMIQVVFGLSIAFAATSFFMSFFSFAGGALID